MELAHTLETVILRPWVATPWLFQVIGGLWWLWLGMDLITPRRRRNRPAVDGYTTLIAPSEHAVGFGRWSVLCGAGFAAVGVVHAAAGAAAVGWMP